MAKIVLQMNKPLLNSRVTRLWLTPVKVVHFLVVHGLFNLFLFCLLCHHNITNYFISFFPCRGGGGVCVNCQHNTQGRHCDQCKDGYFRDLSIPIDSPVACNLCGCYTDGTVGGNPDCEPVCGCSICVIYRVVEKIDIYCLTSGKT